ncbi:KipI antagonist [Sporosarcina sp. P37]|uniref:5-oxoprolinase subunit C family protein n=1 Tax=unclassified Sporosarcina TaxID=2647733 RepID=UPI000A179CEE|nr:MULTISPECIES: biotin-dependent carboxyltransferase family protein [unclassified Sporosarcina]ARK25525.1 KipI antagonist [Sporosarcina sp. P37]PID17779.1 KipI antagonist [Sporosarcina sp. P35]
MSVNVLNPGLLTTVQDIGRTGSQKFGVLVSGAMDSYSMRIANLLVGNDEREGVLEITLFGTGLQFDEDTLIAITGGDLQTTVDGIHVPNWRPLLIRKGSVLKFGFSIEGCRAYLAIAGGIDIPVVMGSKSTYLVAGIGGFNGRALQQNDTLSFGELTESNERVWTSIEKLGGTADWAVPYHPFISLESVQTIRIIKGTEYERFNDTSKKRLVTQPYVVTPQSNRMGLRLEGSELALIEKLELLSEGVTFGTVQIPPNGKPIILMADRQTAGGYPKIAQVITADLGSLSQVKPNSKLHFQLITHAEAERELIAKEELVNQIKIGIRYKFSK